MELPHPAGKSFPGGSRMIGEAIKFLEFFFLKHASNGGCVVSCRVDIGAQVSTQASRILFAYLACV
jgi:hypothetical protein